MITEETFFKTFRPKSDLFYLVGPYSIGLVSVCGVFLSYVFMSKSRSASRVPDRLKDYHKPSSSEGDKGMPSSKTKSKSSSSVSGEAGKTVKSGNSSKDKVVSRTSEKDFNTSYRGRGRRASTSDRHRHSLCSWSILRSLLSDRIPSVSRDQRNHHSREASGPSR